MKHLIYLIRSVMVLCTFLLSCSIANAGTGSVNFNWAVVINRGDHPEPQEGCDLIAYPTLISLGGPDMDNIDPSPLFDTNWKLLATGYTVTITLANCDIKNLTSIPKIRFSGDLDHADNPYLFNNKTIFKGRAQGFGILVFDSDTAKEGAPGTGGGNEIANGTTWTVPDAKTGQPYLGNHVFKFAVAMGCGSSAECSSDNVISGKMRSGLLKANITIQMLYS